MEWYEVAVIVGPAVVFLLLGYLWGGASERAAWVMRANRGIAHHVDGTFFYIHTEHYFIDNYQLREREEAG